MKSSPAKQALSKPKLLQKVYSVNNIEGETFISDHIFSYVISGTHELWIGDRKYFFRAGDYHFFRRHQLTKSFKRPESEGFRCITIHIDQDTLRKISLEYDLKSNGLYNGEGVKILKENRFMKSFVNTLHPYLDGIKEDCDIVRQKTKELILILLDCSPDLKQMLFEFDDPGKIDLEMFMNAHYRYNVSIGRFAFLTGRNVSGFKRDFARLFGLSPGKWLMQKRLAEARYLIEQEFHRPIEIYLDLGFINISHFSYAYKKAFGIVPRTLF